MRRSLAFAAVLALAVASPACSSKEPGPTSTAAPLLVRAVDWQSSSDSVGAVQAVAELDGDVAVFSDAGAIVLVGGVVASSDTSVKSWQAATTIPAADGSGTWIVGVDGDGHVLRLRSASLLEDVSDRYGLSDVKIRSVAALGGARVAFGGDGVLAIADGKTVTRWTTPDFAHLAGGGGRVAAVTSAGVEVFDADASSFVQYPLGGAVATAVASDGTVLAATARTVYVERTRGGLDEIYDSPDLDVRVATASDGRFWVALGPELLTLSRGDDFAPARTSGAQLKTTTTLSPGANEAVWTLADGVAHKLVLDQGSASDQQDWQTTVQPVFARVCSQCHLPGGTSGYDLSTYASWLAQRAEIEKRVVVQKDMPPSGVTMSDADRATVAAWVKAHAQ